MSCFKAIYMCNRMNVFIDNFFVQNWVLLYVNEYAKLLAELILMLYIHCPLSFHDKSGAS